jgi:hypothetical protein
LSSTYLPNGNFFVCLLLSATIQTRNQLQFNWYHSQCIKNKIFKTNGCEPCSASANVVIGSYPTGRKDLKQTFRVRLKGNDSDSIGGVNTQMGSSPMAQFAQFPKTRIFA